MTNAETNTAANVAEQGAHVAPEKASSKKGATKRKEPPRRRARPRAENRQGCQNRAAPKKAAMGGKKAAKSAPAKKASAPSRREQGREDPGEDGARQRRHLTEIMKATDWQAHSVRGFISAVAKKQSIKIDSAKNEGGNRVYKIVK